MICGEITILAPNILKFLGCLILDLDVASEVPITIHLSEVDGCFVCNGIIGEFMIPCNGKHMRKTSTRSSSTNSQKVVVDIFKNDIA